MIHYSCDRCQRLIETEHELRYVVRLEIEAKISDEVSDDLEDVDGLMEIDEIIERQDDALDSFVDDEVYNRKRFDLCCNCYKHFIKNPLAGEKPKTVGFSDN